MPGGASASIVVVFNATSPYINAYNTAYVHANGGGSNSSTNFTNISGWSLQVQKISLDPVVELGDTVRFLIIASNTGNSSVDPVYIEESFSSNHLEIISWENMGDRTWTRTGSTQWKLNGPLASQSSASFMVTFRTKQVGVMLNTAYVHSNTGGSNQSTNFTNVTDYQTYTYKFVNGSSIVTVGDQVIFGIVVSTATIGPNPKNISGIFIEDTIPDGLVYDSYTSFRGNWSHSVSDDGRHRWTLDGDLLSGNYVQILVVCNASKVGNFTNFATGGSSDTNNTTANASVLVQGLIVEKITNNVTVAPGENVEFTIRVMNSGNTTLNYVFVVEKPSEGLVYIDYANKTGNWTYDGIDKWTLAGGLDANETAEFIVIYNATKIGNLTNVIVVGSNETKNQTANNTTTVLAPGMEVIKITNNQTVKYGETVEFTIVVRNTGETNLTDVFVEERPSEGLVYLDYVNKTGNWNKDGGIWTLAGNLELGGTAEFTVIYNATKTGNLTNLIVAGSNQTENQTADNNTTVISNPGLTVEKLIIGNQTVKVGETVGFTIVVTNIGDQDLTGVFVEEQIPEGLVYLDYVNKTGSWDKEGNKWTLAGNLEYGGTAELVIIFNTTEVGNLTNIVVAGSDDTPNETANNTTTVINPSLTVVKVSNNVTVKKGEKVEFVIIVTNNGDEDLTGVFVKEEIPDGLAYSSFISESGKWFFNGADMWIYDGTLAAGESSNLTIIFDTEKAGNLTNVVVAGSDETPNETANNTTEVTNPNLTVSKYANNGTVYAGNLTEYTIVVNNTGECDLTGVFVEEQAPDGLVYVDFVDESNKWTYDEETHVFTYNGVLVPGEVVQFVVIFNTTKSGNYTNVVTYGSDQTENSTNESGNMSVVFTPDMEVVKIANDEVVYVGNITSYTIQVTNTGDCDLTNVFVEEQAPEGLVYIDYVNRTGTWDKHGNKWTYVGALAPGKSASFVVIYNTTKSMNIDNVVIAGSNETGNETTNNNTTDVFSPDFEVVKIANDEVVYVGNITSYTIEVTNTGDCDLTRVFVEEQAPEGLVYVDYVEIVGSWDKQGNKWTYEGTLAPGDSVAFVVIYNTTKSMNIDNVVIAGSNETGNETTNNNTTNVYSPDFEVVKVANDEVVYAGNITSYTIEVTNTGDCDLTNVFVEEQAPEGLIYIDYVNRTGTWDKEGDKWTYVGALAPGKSASFVVIYNTTKSMNIDNVVIAGSNETGNETTNNNTTNVYSPKFDIVKVASDEVVYAGNTTSYTIEVTNYIMG